VKNNYSLILNAILVVAVAVLFYLHFNSDLSSSLATSDEIPTIDLSKKAFSVPKNLSTSRVLYVNIDSVGVKYDAYADLSLETNAKANALQNQYQKKARALQSRLELYQQNDAKQLLSDNEKLREETALNEGNEELQKMQEQMGVLENSAMGQNAKITNDITNFFKVFYKDKKIDFILGYGGGSGVLYANDSLDITNEVLQSLNENYRLIKKSAKK